MYKFLFVFLMVLAVGCDSNNGPANVNGLTLHTYWGGDEAHFSGASARVMPEVCPGQRLMNGLWLVPIRMNDKPYAYNTEFGCRDVNVALMVVEKPPYGATVHCSSDRFVFRKHMGDAYGSIDSTMYCELP